MIISLVVSATAAAAAVLLLCVFRLIQALESRDGMDRIWIFPSA